MGKLTASDEASSRTKNRLREHKNLGSIRETSSHHLFDGRPAALLVCADCGWLGWIPLDELGRES